MFHIFHTRAGVVLAGTVLLLAMLACSVGASGFGQPTVGPLQLPTNPPQSPTSVPLPSTGSTGPTVSAPTPGNLSNSATTTAPIPSTSTGNFALNIRDVASKVKPAIVQITNEQVQVDQFNQPFTTPAGVGSGVIYDNQGHVLTNNHVIEGAQKLLVSLPDGRSFPGKLVGADPQTDLAVVQISADNLPVAELGDSTKLQVGDWVVAIGNALALPGGPTVSAGVVSAIGRSVQEPGSQNSNQAGPFLFDLIQTDAPINPGNSGGALVNLAGQVVGINTLVAGQAEPGVQAQGIGFAISIATAKPIADQIVASGRVVHPYMGIEYQPLNPAIASQLGIQQIQGVLVGNVVSGSPAEAAGLQPNDVITSIDNTPLKEDTDLAKIIQSHKPGDVVTLTVVRGNQQRQIKLTLGTMPG